jgi:hypothetical protein
MRLESFRKAHRLFLQFDMIRRPEAEQKEKKIDLQKN